MLLLQMFCAFRAYLTEKKSSVLILLCPNEHNPSSTMGKPASTIGDSKWSITNITTNKQKQRKRKEGDLERNGKKKKTRREVTGDIMEETKKAISSALAGGTERMEFEMT